MSIIKHAPTILQGISMLRQLLPKTRQQRMLPGHLTELLCFKIQELIHLRFLLQLSLTPTVSSTLFTHKTIKESCLMIVLPITVSHVSHSRQEDG